MQHCKIITTFYYCIVILFHTSITGSRTRDSDSSYNAQRKAGKYTYEMLNWARIFAFHGALRVHCSTIYWRCSASANQIHKLNASNKRNSAINVKWTHLDININPSDKTRNKRLTALRWNAVCSACISQTSLVWPCIFCSPYQHDSIWMSHLRTALTSTHMMPALLALLTVIYQNVFRLMHLDLRATKIMM